MNDAYESMLQCKRLQEAMESAEERSERLDRLERLEQDREILDLVEKYPDLKDDFNVK